MHKGPVKQVAVGHTHLHPVFAGGIDNGIAIRHGESHGLLDKYMASMFHGLHSERSMRAGWRTDIDNVWLFLGQHLRQVGIGMRNAKRLGNLLYSLRIDIADSSQLDSMVVFQVGGDMLLRSNQPGSYNGSTQ
jgi:hypothetical protein